MNGCRRLYISVEGSQCIASVRRYKPSLWVAYSAECWMDFEYIYSSRMFRMSIRNVPVRM